LEDITVWAFLISYFLIFFFGFFKPNFYYIDCNPSCQVIISFFYLFILLFKMSRIRLIYSYLRETDKYYIPYFSHFCSVHLSPAPVTELPFALTPTKALPIVCPPPAICLTCEAFG